MSKKNPAAVATRDGLAILKQWCSHLDKCDVVTEPHPKYNPCSCGLDAALASLGPPQKQYAVALGKLGGRVRSDAKASASRENGKKGGRPRKAGAPLPSSEAPGHRDDEKP
jgi:hypothetical protein